MKIVAETKETALQEEEAGMIGTVPNPAYVDTIEKWFAECFHNNIISQNSEVYKAVYEAKEKLIEAMGGRK